MNKGIEKFTDLENKVYRAIELFKAVRIQKEALEKELLKVKAQLEETRKENEHLNEQMLEHKSEREQVRERVETLLQNLETLTH